MRLLPAGRRGVLPLVAAAAMLAAAVPAGAAAGAALTLSKASGPPGAKVAANGTGFTAGETVQLNFAGTQIGKATASSGGDFEFNFTIPQGYPPLSTQKVEADGQTSLTSASATFKIESSWSEFGLNSTHQGANPNEDTITAKNVAGLNAGCSVQSPGITEGSSVVSGGVIFTGGSGGITANREGNCSRAWPGSNGLTAAPVVGTPAVSGGLVFAATSDGTVYAFHTSNGKQAWSTSAGDEMDGGVTLFGGALYVAGLLKCNGIVALNAKTGAIDWSVTVADDLTQPTVGTVGGKTMVFAGSTDGSVYALDGATGQDDWAATVGPAVSGSPALSGSTLYAATDGAKPNTLTALNAGSGATLWSKPIANAGADGTPVVIKGSEFIAAGSHVYDFGLGGQKRWAVTMPVAVNSTLAYANGVLFGSSPAGLLKCDGFALSPGTGAEIWDADDTGSPGAAAGPPIVVDGRVWIGFANGVETGFQG